MIPTNGNPLAHRRRVTDIGVRPILAAITSGCPLAATDRETLLMLNPLPAFSRTDASGASDPKKTEWIVSGRAISVDKSCVWGKARPFFLAETRQNSYW